MDAVPVQGLEGLLVRIGDARVVELALAHELPGLRAGGPVQWTTDHEAQQRLAGQDSRRGEEHEEQDGAEVHHPPAFPGHEPRCRRLLRG